MALTRKHEELVVAIVDWANATFGPNARARYHADCVLAPGMAKPPCIGGYIPDFFAEIEKSVVIGEAKTITDLETPHSQQQLRSAVSYFQSLCQSTYLPNCILVIATPWPAKNAAKRIMRFINKQVKFSNYTLNVLPK